MAEFLYNAPQNVALNQAAIFDASIPCPRGNVIHENETGNFILRGSVSNPNSCFARYHVTAGGNIALPTGATPVGPIAMAISVNGEVRPTSKAIVTPSAAGDYFNITCTAIIDVPRGCCFNIALRNTAASDDPTVTPAPLIMLQNANIVINRIA